MRELLRGAVVRVVLTTAVTVAGPLFLLLIWWAATGRSLPSTIATPVEAIVILAGLFLVLIGVALVVGFWWVSRVVGLIVPPLERIVGHAERLDDGASVPKIGPTGVAEIDRLTASLHRRSVRVWQRLAAERDFAADASHQLRTPLTALLMRLEEIASTDDLEVVADEAHIAIAQVERLSGVVDDLLARSRSGAEGPPVVALDTVLASLQREWQHSFAAQRRTIHVTGERGLKVRAAPGALAQIFSTLFENALAHGAGTVRVSARRVGPSVAIQVSDEGEGVPASMAPHVFERSVSSSGSGLGLTLARDLAAAQGGRLELLQSQGAVFALFLSEGSNA